MYTQEVGREGENLARNYLESIGYEILQRNLRLGHGEIDILARDGDVLVVVEVKTRRSTAFGRAEEQLTAGKLRTLRNLAARVAAAHPGVSVRVDVIAVAAHASPSGPLEGAVITHLQGVAL